MNETTPQYSRRSALQRGLVLAGGAGLAMAALGRPAATWAQAQTTDVGRLVAANLDFGFRLYAALAKGSGGQNLFYSPLSVSLALEMVYNGARTTTQQAMARTLGLGSMGTPLLNSTSASLLAHLQALDSKVALSIADSLWLRRGYTLLPAFQQAVAASYGAQISMLDFADPHAPGTINAWVNRQTHGLIPSIIKDIPSQMILYVINALYFKAPWSSPFRQSSTSPGPFTIAGGQQKTLPMMRNLGAYHYVKAAGYEAIALPYAAGKLAMYIVLPSVSNGLHGFQSGLDAATWSSLIQSLTPQEGTIVLPRFGVDYSASLNAALSALGMGIAFDTKRADLSGMVQLTGQRAYISEVKHRSVLKVDEQGTLAAAVTSVGVGAMSMPQAVFSMVVNRPFFCAIRDETTGTLLFMGAITNPS
jgi:serpin B